MQGGSEPVNLVLSVVSAAGAVGSVIAHFLIAAWYNGRLTEKVAGNSAEILELKAGARDHESRISRIEGHLEMKEGGSK